MWTPLGIPTFPRESLIAEVPGMISENSTVTVGVIIASAGFLIGGVWWASSVQTKLDILLKIITSTNTTVQDLSKRVETVETDVAVLKAKYKT